MRILIAGASGYIPSAIARVALDQGHAVGAIRRPESTSMPIANLLISILEGATAVTRINKRSAALDDAQRHLNLYLETVVRLRTDS